MTFLFKTFECLSKGYDKFMTFIYQLGSFMLRDVCSMLHSNKK